MRISDWSSDVCSSDLATMEDEALQRAEALVTSAAGTLTDESGIRPSITVRQGDPVAVVRHTLEEMDDVAALVLGAAASGHPGVLVSHFAGADAEIGRAHV